MILRTLNLRPLQVISETFNWTTRRCWPEDFSPLPSSRAWYTASCWTAEGTTPRQTTTNKRRSSATFAMRWHRASPTANKSNTAPLSDSARALAPAPQCRGTPPPPTPTVPANASVGPGRPGRSRCQPGRRPLARLKRPRRCTPCACRAAQLSHASFHAWLPRYAEKSPGWPCAGTLRPTTLTNYYILMEHSASYRTRNHMQSVLPRVWTIRVAPDCVCLV